MPHFLNQNLVDKNLDAPTLYELLSITIINSG